MDNLSPNQQPTPDPKAPLTIGQELRQAREAAGLSINEVAERTKVRPGLLTDIEQDAHHKLPALTYSLGFVKAYARTVGVDPNEAAERYRAQSNKGAPQPTIVDLEPLEAQRIPSRGLMGLSFGVLLVALLGFWAWGAGWFSGSSQTAESTSEEIAAEAPTEVTDNGHTTQAEAQSEATPAAPIVPATAPVTVTASTDVWLRIADGDETFYMGTMSAGQSMTLPAGRAWTLRTGRAGALNITVGGQAIPPLGDLATTVRNQSLAPADLLALADPSQAAAAAPVGTPAPAVAAPTGLQQPVQPAQAR